MKKKKKLSSQSIDAENQLALTLYRLAHGCSFIVINDLFGISKSLAVQTFNKVVRELVMNIYNDYIKLPSTCFFYKHDVYKHIQAQVW